MKANPDNLCAVQLVPFDRADYQPRPAAMIPSVWRFWATVGVLPLYLAVSNELST